MSDLAALREQLYQHAQRLGAEELDTFEQIIGDVGQLLAFRYGATAKLRHGDLVQVVAPEKSSVRGLVGFVVDPEAYGADPGDEPDAGGVPVVFTYVDERGGVRLYGRVARDRLRRVGASILTPEDDDQCASLGVCTVPDRDELAAAAERRADHA
jgi:hypothetical protein